MCLVIPEMIENTVLRHVAKNCRVDIFVKENVGNVL